MNSAVPQNASTYANRLAEIKRREAALGHNLVEALRGGAPDAIHSAFSEVDRMGDWRAAFRLLLRAGTNIHADSKTLFQQAWAIHGDHIRGEVQDDLLLIEVLRLLTPAYFGGSLRLYRGDSASNRRYRRYGLSWSTDREVAKSFALGTCRWSPGGSVLLFADAPVAAIISVLNYEDEREVLVDRRLLGNVRILERFPQEGNAAVS